VFDSSSQASVLANTLNRDFVFCHFRNFLLVIHSLF